MRGLLGDLTHFSLVFADEEPREGRRRLINRAEAQDQKRLYRKLVTPFLEFKSISQIIYTLSTKYLLVGLRIITCW